MSGDVNKVDEALRILSKVEEILRGLRGSIEQADRIRSENEALKSDLEKLKAEVERRDLRIKDLENENNELKSKLKEKEEEVKRLSERVASLEDENRKLEQELKITRENLSNVEKSKKEVEEENKKLKDELNKISEQLEKISKMYGELTRERERVESVRELLTIYVTLLETVFAGMPHARILWLLHGVPKMKRAEITKASGFEPAVVLKSIHDLERAGLVRFNRQKDEVHLLRKLF